VSGGSKALAMTDAEIAQIPATLGGSAVHNVLNAAMALALTSELALGPAALDGLRRFGADPRDNLGRLMRYEVGGVTVVIDYAHNPQSVAALIDATRHWPAVRRAVALGTGGDRDDDALRAIAGAAFGTGIIDHYIVKEMPRFLRGRAPGSISEVLRAELCRVGVPETQIVAAPDDLSAVRSALQWAHAGDLLLLGVHDQREVVLALLADLARSGWHPGMPIPD
jgi:cyanophycin synthetase